MSDRPTPETDAVYFTPHMTLYDMAGAMKCVERQRDEALRAVERLHDWLSVANNWLAECRGIYGETYAWPVNNDDLDLIPTILKDIDHLIP